MVVSASRALSALKQTTASLAAFEKAIAQSGGSLSFSIGGTGSSGTQAQSCDFAALIANAPGAILRRRGGSFPWAGSPAFPARPRKAREIVRRRGRSLWAIPAIRVHLGYGVALGESGSFGPVVLIVVESPVSAGLDDIAGALSQAEITGGTLSAGHTQTYTSNGNAQSYLLRSFTLAASFADLKNAFAKLTAAQAIAKQNSGLTLSISSAIPQTSPQAQPVCSQAASIADAAMQAQALAGAGGVSMGPVTALGAAPAAAGQTRVGALSL